MPVGRNGRRQDNWEWEGLKLIIHVYKLSENKITMKSNKEDLKISLANILYVLCFIEIKKR